MDFTSEEFLKAILDPDGNSRIEILNSKLDASIVGKETSYVSSIIGLTIDYEKDGQISKGKFIIKVLAASPLYDVGKLCGLYDRELEMYSEILPEMSKLLKPDIFYPLSFKSIYEEVSILENLKAEGYSTINRMKQLNLPECVVALKMLAKFHAASVKLNKTMNLQDKSDVWFKHEGKENLFTMIFQNGYEMVVEILGEKFPECVEKVKGMKEDIFKVTKTIVNGNKNGFNVLNHGDYHMINIMFKHDENGNVVDGKMFDFQISRWCSPVVDIVYFLISSAQFEVFKAHLNELLSFYVKVLNDDLKKYECVERYELNDIKKDFEDSWKLGMFILVVFGPLILVEPSDPLEFDDIAVEERVDFDNIKKSYESKKYKQVLFDWISYYHQKGCF